MQVSVNPKWVLALNQWGARKGRPDAVWPWPVERVADAVWPWQVERAANASKEQK
jgi:hypothetical protein